MWAEDNGPADADPRSGFLATEGERAILGQGRLDLRESGKGAEQVVFLRGSREGNVLRMSQDGFESYQGRFYEYPLHLEGGPNTPYDAPDAEVSSLARYEAAVARFEAAWSAA